AACSGRAQMPDGAISMGSNAAASSDTPRRRLADNPSLTEALTARICESLLPGDTPFATDKVREAAAFMLDTASRRAPGEVSIALASATDGRRFMRIALINDDMPFLVDSVAATIAAQGLAIDRLVHPVVHVRRDAEGALKEIASERGDDTHRESMIYVETVRIDARQRRELERALRVTLTDVRAAVADWPKMREAMRADAARIEDAEGADLLRWLESGMLTQL